MWGGGGRGGGGKLLNTLALGGMIVASNRFNNRGVRGVRGGAKRRERETRLAPKARPRQQAPRATPSKIRHLHSCVHALKMSGFGAFGAANGFATPATKTTAAFGSAPTKAAGGFGVTPGFGASATKAPATGFGMAKPVSFARRGVIGLRTPVWG